MKSFNLKSPVNIIALGFGSGLAPKAPGTFGTLAAIPMVILMSYLSLPLYLLITFLSTVIGIYICGKAAENAGVHDHPAIVWDEFVGFMVTMIAIPISWQTILVAFILFRIFDIVKPWPISWLDKNCHGGFGIMVDDVVAGFCALLIMHIIY